ncbi:MAG TPA: MurR/RpiR family transcriptional regulator [Polyangiaceae bacterium]|nr:MurR/RpiR family transcriptional regulator [Polyangiaceae bacterium]
MNQSVAVPKTFDSLHKAIVGQYPQLSKRLQQIASYALDNPSELALETIATVAQRARVQPSSLIRFAKAFGYSGYSDMQRVFRLRLTGSLPDYEERLRNLEGAHSSTIKDSSALLARFVQADIAGLQSLAEQRRMGELLDKSIKLLANAECVYLVAHRRSFPITFYLSYALSQLNVRNVLVDGVGGLFFHQVRHATKRDVVFAVSTKSYSPDVVEAVRESAERGVRVIALTDSPLSPLVQHAAISLEVQQASVQMFRSLAVPMTLAITLIVGLGRALDKRKTPGIRRDI